LAPFDAPSRKGCTKHLGTGAPSIELEDEVPYQRCRSDRFEPERQPVDGHEAITSVPERARRSFRGEIRFLDSHEPVGAFPGGSPRAAWLLSVADVRRVQSGRFDHIAHSAEAFAPVSCRARSSGQCSCSATCEDGVEAFVRGHVRRALLDAA